MHVHRVGATAYLPVYQWLHKMTYDLQIFFKKIPLVVVGIGWAMFFVSLISCCYYNMLVAYSFFYTFASFASDVPWRDCGNSWNSPGRCSYLFIAFQF